jgi:hypothetical protein
MTSRSDLMFQAAVERPLSIVFQTPSGAWEGHDFRVLEETLDRWLAPLHGQLLSAANLRGPLELAQRLLEELAPRVPAPARLVEVALTDGRGHRLSVKPPR